MKAVKIICGGLAGIYALAHCVYLPTLLLRGAQPSSLLGNLAGLCIGAAVAYALLRSAFKQKIEEEKMVRKGSGLRTQEHTNSRTQEYGGGGYFLLPTAIAECLMIAHSKKQQTL